MAMMMGEDFQYVLRILNTNVDGRQKVMYAMCAIKGIGRRLSCLICKKADIDLTKRAGELTNDEVDRIITIVQNPRQFKIPDWFLNRQKDKTDGKYSQVRQRPAAPLHVHGNRRAGARGAGGEGARRHAGGRGGRPGRALPRSERGGSGRGARPLRAAGSALRRWHRRGWAVVGAARGSRFGLPGQAMMSDARAHTL